MISKLHLNSDKTCKIKKKSTNCCCHKDGHVLLTTPQEYLISFVTRTKMSTSHPFKIEILKKKSSSIAKRRSISFQIICIYTDGDTVYSCHCSLMQ